MKKIIFITFFVLISFILFAHPKYHKDEHVVFPGYEETRADSAHGFDVQHYDLSIEIYDSNQYIEGTVIATVLAEEILTEIQYELESLNVNEVLVNGNPASYTHTAGVITIDLGTINPDEEFTSTVGYSGNPVWIGLGMYFSANYVFTISDPNASRYWWPCYDHPWDKALVDLTITCRDDWEVASNGIRTDIVNNGNGTRTHFWEGSNPMTTFLASIVARNYVELNDSFQGVPIQNFVPPSMVTAATEDFSNLPFMMEVFSNLYGFYPFEKYGNAVTSFLTYAAMEHQTMTTMTTGWITGNHYYETGIAHELAHSWFGNCLTPLTWADVWLSEGFAVYSEALYMEQWQGFAAMVNYMIVSIQNYYKNWAGSQGYIVYDPPPGSYFTPATYEKPASVLHMLRLMTGNEVFFDILQTYFLEYYNGNVITTDFREICEQVSGLDLEQFFQQWIFEPGIPSFEYTYFVKDYNTNPEILICVKTTSNTTTDFYQPVPFHINYRTRTDSIIVDSAPDVPAETIVGPFPPEFEEVEFDPNSWILSRGDTFKFMEITGVYSADNIVVIYWNELWEDFEVDGYNLYRSESYYGPYEIINSELITENSFLDDTVTNGTTYFYKVNAVKYDDFESPFSYIVEAIPMNFPLDQGILVIDETKDGPGIPGNPTDEMVDEFYQDVMNCEFTSYDYADEGAPSLDVIKNYSTIVWHDDDLSENFIGDNINNLGCYLISGGNLIISGWKTVTEIPGFFIGDFLNCFQTELVSAFECISVFSDDYADLDVNLEKLPSAFNALPYISIFPDAENDIYFYGGLAGSQYEGEITAIKSQLDGTFVLLGFPLYYFYEDGVTGFFDQLLDEIGETGLENVELQISNIKLSNYPNPFNPETTINFETTNLHEFTRIEIYNLKGQKIRTLENLESVSLSPKSNKAERLGYSITWDGRDDNDQSVGSGIYFYKLMIGEKDIASNKMLLLK